MIRAGFLRPTLTAPSEMGERMNVAGVCLHRMLLERFRRAVR
jgi:hypothetical protein